MQRANPFCRKKAAIMACASVNRRLECRRDPTAGEISYSIPRKHALSCSHVLRARAFSEGPSATRA